MNRILWHTRIGAAAILLCASISWSGVVNASDLQKHDFRIAVTDDSEITKRIVDALQKKLPSAKVTIADPKKRIQGKRNTVSIAVGPSAFRALLAQNTDGIVISLFTSSQAYNAILESRPDQYVVPITAIYAEPSPDDQLRLISMLYKKRVGVAVLISDKAAYLKPVLQQVARQKNLDLTFEHISPGDSLNRALNNTASLPVLLAIPDSTIYNAESIRNILITAYRHNQSVIGFSAAFVRAGALASIYSSIDDIVTQVDELIDEYENTGRLPEPRFPKYFSVIVNDDVARSLNIVVDNSTRTFSHKSGGGQP